MNNQAAVVGDAEQRTIAVLVADVSTIVPMPDQAGSDVPGLLYGLQTVGAFSPETA